MTRRNKCDVCRFRKIKCDEAYPTCSQCERSARPCTYEEAGFGKEFSRHKAVPGIRIKTIRQAPEGKGAFITLARGDNASYVGTCKTGSPSQETVVAPCSYEKSGNFAQLKETTLGGPAVSVPKTAILGLNSASAFRAQLVTVYLDCYSLSQNFPAKEVTAAYQYWITPAGKAMELAIDSILLLHLSRTTGKVDAAVAGRSRYSQALCHLRNKVRLRDAAWDDDVLGATHALTIAGQYRGLVSTMQHWAAHVRGLETIIKTRGSACVRSDSAITIILVSITRSVMNAIITRKPHFYGEPEWQKALKPVCSSPQGRIARVTARLPTLLADVDHLSAQSKRGHAVDTGPLLLKLSQWQHKAQSCLCSLLSNGDSVLSATHKVERDSGVGIAGSHHLLDEYLFTATYALKDVHAMFLFIWYWIIFFQATSAELDLMELDRSKHNDEVLAKAHERCEIFAANLCNIVPYLRSANHTAAADVIACKGAEFAQRWYEKTGNAKKAKWCLETRRSLDEVAETFVLL